jgi:hypothetical protein
VLRLAWQAGQRKFFHDAGNSALRHFTLSEKLETGHSRAGTEFPFALVLMSSSRIRGFGIRDAQATASLAKKVLRRRRSANVQMEIPSSG